MSDRESNTFHDVLIIGGGLAGLTLARQLLMADPDLDICIVHNRKFPNPERIHKVGESTVEIGAHYLAQTLGCVQHLNTQHYKKMGLRFIQTSGVSEEDPYRELGLSFYPRHNTYQIDRGKLENHLLDLVQPSITVIENNKVIDFEKKGDLNQVTIRDHDGACKTTSARWVIDASGRSRVLMKKFGLQKEAGIDHSAIWFRVGGRVDINEFLASRDPANSFLDADDRWHSTTHLVGRGYWVWIIPINEQTTSIGIVFDNSIHKLSSMSAYPLAMSWLKQHEPRFHSYMEAKNFDVLDFAMLRNYSYLSKQYISADGWALTGEAAGFVDPLYSNGTDLIGLANTMITNAITKADGLSLIDQMNDFLEETYGVFAETHRSSYGYFDDWNYVFVKTNWDTVFYFLLMCVLFMNNKSENVSYVDSIHGKIYDFINLHKEVMEFLKRPGAVTEDYVLSDFINLAGSIQDYASGAIISLDKSDEGISELLDRHMEILKELAASIMETRTFDRNFYEMGGRLMAKPDQDALI
ncbi:NAD(P)/FAD-dependent oxidoreductase [Asaia prunellae]|uniref:NAD(P)/FAD-dependent oxidoreductase n=1 Tax=Asaia prunellae TaxID=610245 RepID=UPI00046E5585|nr:tryptophan 7-halogenase [Asaia prunellae]